MFESTVPAGEGPPIHIHHNEDEVIHVLAGEYEFWLDGATPGWGRASRFSCRAACRIPSASLARRLGAMWPC